MSKKLLQLAKILEALSDINRLKILKIVFEKNMQCSVGAIKECTSCNCTCHTELQKKLKLSKSTVSHHVNELVDCGLITTHKNGKWSYLKLNPKKIKEVMLFLKAFLNPADKIDKKDVELFKFFKLTISYR